MKIPLNTAEEIRNAIDSGEKVFSGNESYRVIKDRINQYLIHYIHSDHYIGLTWTDETTLNGNDFYFIQPDNQA